jgi:hypothetical protein
MHRMLGFLLFCYNKIYEIIFTISIEREGFDFIDKKQQPGKICPSYSKVCSTRIKCKLYVSLFIFLLIVVILMDVYKILFQ